MNDPRYTASVAGLDAEEQTPMSKQAGYKPDEPEF